jgi:hypothetical protein
VPPARGRSRLSSLAGVDSAQLRRIHADLVGGAGERSA